MPAWVFSSASLLAKAFSAILGSLLIQPVPVTVNTPRATRLFMHLTSGAFSRLDTFDETKNRLKFAARGLMTLPYTLRWLDFIAADAQRLEFVRRRPRIASKLHRPYLMQSMGTARRLAVLIDHYTLQQQRFPAALHARLLADEDVLLATLAGKNDKTYRVILTQKHSFEKEGELSLRMVDAADNALAVTTFSFYMHDRQPALLIGGLQGPRQSRDHAIIKEATKSCHGLFPKKLVVEALMELARRLGIKQIHAVSKEAHIYNHWRYRKDFQADYNTFWQELGAEPLNSSVYTLPEHIYHKPIEEVESKKRAEYTRRYALLADLREQIGTTLKECG